MRQVCINCGEDYEADEIIYFCRRCGDLLEIEYDYEELAERLERSDWRSLPLSVWRYRDFLPVRDPSKVVSLNEGGTGLHLCSRLAKVIGLKRVYVKNEGENPTGSFKDRGMTVGVTKALELNMKTVICASTGNTSASLAAYAAKAGLRCIVLVPSGKIAYGKLVQALAYGAEIVQVRGNFDQALRTVIELSERHGEVYLLNSINPYRLEGQKSLAYEVCDQLGGRAPDRVILPVGNAGNISALWKGFTEFYRLGLVDSLPRMVGVQAEGASPIAQAIKRGSDVVTPVENPETVATAIRIGAPVSWKKALRAIRDSDGTAETVTDEEILEAQSMLARCEGLFVEPASASSIAGLKKMVELGEIDRDETVVCVATGHGLKDPDVMRRVGKPLEADADVQSIERLLGLTRPSRIEAS
ncbi:threonine synthase [Candidatus Bathyarchaeota archaeon]|nr:MAG: threonine synthase [Candidatus Bathyarchaeota archaeon ex4484_40]RJS80117.1 MAG: threonine synthase [Candidatus Bathyarchaeota archaeon]